MVTFKKNRVNPSSEGLVVDLNEMIFRYLGKLSVFYIVTELIRKINGKIDKKADEKVDEKDDKKTKKKINLSHFVDCWVLGHFWGSLILLFLVVKTAPSRMLLWIFFIYAALRVFEVILYQMNVNLFDCYRSKMKNEDYKVKSPTRTVILLLHNYVETIFWYALMVACIVKLSGIGNGHSVLYYIKSSFFCLSTFNFEAIQSVLPGTYTALSRIATFEVLSGLVMTVISLAIFVGQLPREYKKECLKEEEKVIK